MPSTKFASARLGRAVSKTVLILLLASGASAASAQELVHRFINPSFGGNPFNSDHLLGIANIDRPEEPEEEEPEQTPEDIAAEQLRQRLIAQLRSQIEDRIDEAQPGDSGEFNFGNQRVSFVKTETETRVTFLNLTTGETSTIVIPNSSEEGLAALNALSPQQILTPQQMLGTSAPAGDLSAEQVLSGMTSSRSGPLNGSFSNALFGSPPLGSEK